MLGEKRESFLNGELKHLVNVQSLVTNVENGALEARALAFLADQLDIGQELHLYRDRTVALAIFAASAGNIEGKMAGIVAAFFGVGRVGEDFADQIEGFDVGDWVRARG